MVTMKEVMETEGLSPSLDMPKNVAVFFLQSTMAEKTELVDYRDDPQLSNIAGQDFIFDIMDKRIRMVDREIKSLKISLCALMVLSIMAEGNPGKAVFTVIDLMNRTKLNSRDIISCATLSELYPLGFWKMDDVIKIVDKYVKTRQLQYSEIY